MAGGHYAILIASVRESVLLFNAHGFSGSHPYFVQLCGLATSSTMHAAVFHDGTMFDLKRSLSLTAISDLIELEHFFVHHRHSPILTVYLHGCYVCTSVIYLLQKIDLH
jgi:hypothetical protein